MTYEVRLQAGASRAPSGVHGRHQHEFAGWVTLPLTWADGDRLIQGLPQVLKGGVVKLGQLVKKQNRRWLMEISPGRSVLPPLTSPVFETMWKVLAAC